MLKLSLQAFCLYCEQAGYMYSPQHTTFQNVHTVPSSCTVLSLIGTPDGATGTLIVVLMCTGPAAITDAPGC